MERQEIPIRFADLRRLASTVPAYLAGQAGETSTPGLRAGLEESLGLAGFDTADMLTDFTTTYHVDASEFDFTGLISPEGLDSLAGILPLVALAYFPVAWLLKAAASLLCWPLSHHLARRLWQQPVPWPREAGQEQARPNPLTIDDFVASAAVGRFVRREQVYFRLIR